MYKNRRLIYAVVCFAFFVQKLAGSPNLETEIKVTGYLL